MPGDDRRTSAESYFSTKHCAGSRCDTWVLILRPVASSVKGVNLVWYDNGSLIPQISDPRASYYDIPKGLGVQELDYGVEFIILIIISCRIRYTMNAWEADRGQGL